MLQLFRIIAFLEGVSYIGLVFVGMPFKYFKDDPSVVKLLGMPHGVLFMAYVVLAIIITNKYKLSQSVFLKLMLASILPFGTFYADKHYLKPLVNG
ncbi:MAG: hypothetical protein BM564_12275 [Bacteroidetes bacterium MedPE-SWsnd-G2]|nr:MAG: hypothetical protein BM564_12275 [Bacteroidetes bacterium MedPE-SWsnd-G2]